MSTRPFCIGTYCKLTGAKCYYRPDPPCPLGWLDLLLALVRSWWESRTIAEPEEGPKGERTIVGPVSQETSSGLPQETALD